MKKLSSKNWLFLFFGTLAGLVLIIWPAFNVLTDPFGAFGDPVFKWWSYDETMNPRVAKISYLREHHDEYDSYIIGCSSTSSLPVEAFNTYLDASFYNMTVYGSDMEDSELLVNYLIENYDVKNIVLNAYIGNSQGYSSDDDTITSCLPAQVSGKNTLLYYAKYLFANPEYGLEKLKCWKDDSYVQATYDVFDSATGAYDKSRRDVEGIDDLESYISQPDYSTFADYPEQHLEMADLEEVMGSISRIKEICEENGVNLLVISVPVYVEALTTWWDQEDVERWFTALAETTDFWDFSYSSISCDPRYFYDETHFRNSVGNMIAAKIFDDETYYIPEDFGTFVTKENVADYLADYWDVTVPDESEYTTKIPILLYHHLQEDEGTGSSMSISGFEAQIAALTAAGYQAVSFDDLYNYVNYGTDLAENPIIITFDDGYASNYEYAYPILEKYNMCATVFVIGVSVGKDTYKDTDIDMYPHFSWEDALEMENSGIITIESHGYNIHEVEGLDTSPIRQGILQKGSESEADYIAFLNEDCRTMETLFAENMGKTPTVLAYPYGEYDTLSTILVRQNGYYATVTTEEKTSTVIKGLPQSLYALGRYTIDDSITPEELLDMLAQD